MTRRYGWWRSDIMVLLAHVSDTHLGYKQYNLDEREEDFNRAFEEVVDRVIEDHVDVMVHSGDFFDSFRPPVKALYNAKRQLARLKEKGVKVYAVLGDHDLPKRRGMPPHTLFENELTLLGVRGRDGGVRRGCVVKAGGREVYVGGIMNMSRRHRNLLLDELRMVVNEGRNYWRSIVVMHQAIDVYLGYDFQLSIGEIPEGANYYALGHLHSRRKMRLGEGVLAYAGSTEITRRDEISDWKRNGKGFYLVDLSGDVPDVQEVNLNVRPQLEVEVNYERLEEEVGRVVAGLEGGVKPVVHVKVKGSNIDRRGALKVLEGAFSGKVLLWRPEFEEEAGQELTASSVKALSHRELLEEILGGDVAELAWELFRILRGGRGRMEEARRLVKEFFEAGYGDH